MIIEKLQATIQDIPNFPKEGILFKDIMPIFQDPGLCKEVVNELQDRLKTWSIDAIVGVESRGFLLGATLAQQLSIPFVPVRKSGKLPGDTIDYEYDLEYGSATVEIQKGAVKEGWNVLIHDDLLATGGTACAAAELVKLSGGKVGGFAFLVGLKFLEGEEKLQKYTNNILQLITY